MITQDLTREDKRLMREGFWPDADDVADSLHLLDLRFYYEDSSLQSRQRGFKLLLSGALLISCFCGIFYICTEVLTRV